MIDYITVFIAFVFSLLKWGVFMFLIFWFLKKIVMPFLNILRKI